MLSGDFMSLPIILIVIVATYFITIPIVVRIICTRLNKKIPGMFVYGEGITFIAIGVVLFSTLVRVSGYVNLDMPMFLRIYLLLNVAVSIVFYFKDMIEKDKRPDVLNDINKCNLAYTILLCFGEKTAYKFLCGDEMLISKEQWKVFKDENRNKLFKNNLEEFLTFIDSMEEKAIIEKDAKLLSKVIKAKLTYNSDRDSLRLYYSKLYNDSEINLTDKELVIKDMLLSNKKLFKECI